MKIRLLLNIGTASGFPAWNDGDEVEADDKTASILIARGWAVAISEPQPEQTIVKPEPIVEAPAEMTPQPTPTRQKGRR